MRKKTREAYEKVLIEFARIAATQLEKVSKVIIRKIKLRKNTFDYYFKLFLLNFQI